MEIYDIAIAPGQVRDIFCQGSYVYFYSGSAGGADATITVNQDSRGQRVLLQPGQAYRMPGGDAGTRWLIGNHRGEGTIAGRLVIGQGELTDNRVTGSVEVIDGGKARTLTNSAFMGRVGHNGGVGNFAELQLRNPEGSGKNLFVSQIMIATFKLAAISVRSFSAELANIAAPAPSKDAGAAASTAQLRFQSSAALSFEVVGQQYFGADVAAGSLSPIRFSEPLLIRPGRGVLVSSNVTDNATTMNIEYIEEAL